jgi:hypothetical protein
MSYVEFEPTITAFERANTVHAFDRAATVTGCRNMLWVIIKTINTIPGTCVDIIRIVSMKHKRMVK